MAIHCNYFDSHFTDLAPEPTNRLPQNPDPNFIVTRVSPDLRPLFWKHARIEVTWRHPPGVYGIQFAVYII